VLPSNSFDVLGYGPVESMCTPCNTAYAASLHTLMMKSQPVFKVSTSTLTKEDMEVALKSLRENHGEPTIIIGDKSTVDYMPFTDPLETASGVELDRLGANLGCTRTPGTPDADFREFLKRARTKWGTVSITGTVEVKAPPPTLPNRKKDAPW
jgi:hypothetical protein